MPSAAQTELYPPKSWDEFEDIVWELYAREWGDPKAQRYGRSGQAQQGVDIYGQPRGLRGAYVGVQCKRYGEGTLTRAKVEAEIAKAEAFQPPLAEYVIATTEQRDAKLQVAVREIDGERRAAGKFLVHVEFWEDLCSRLCDEANNDLLLKHYGDWARRLIQARGAAPPPYIPPAPPDPETLPDPGDLPPGHRLPFTRNELFTGREGPLKRLACVLLRDQAPSALVTQAVAGMGGVGKTQLAVEFAYRYGRFFHGVHWLNAARPEGLGAEVAVCGEAMALPGWPEKLPEQVSRTLEAWRRGGRRLVVLDNLEEVEAAREWLGKLSGGGARVLVTARRWDWPRDLGLSPLRLEVFTPGESRAFLRRYVGEERAADGELDGLAKRLGHLPLALELAGRYLQRMGRVTVGGYLEKLEEVWAHPSMRSWREELGSPTGHDLDLLATFGASWEQVLDGAARRVFLIAGYCAPNEPIPCEVLEKAAKLDEEGCDEAVGVLAGLGLVEMEDAEKGPVVHPLLAEYARAVAAAEGEEAGVLGAVAGALGKLTHQALESGLPARFAPLRPHVEAVAPAAEDVGLEMAGALWNNLGAHLRTVAEYSGARAAYERALAIHEQVFGREHPIVATVVHNLGSVLCDLGELAGARAALKRALVIDERAYGLDHISVARDVHSLGNVLQSLGDLDEARVAYEWALAIHERIFGREDPDVARDVNSLGGVLHARGDLAGARAAFEQTLAIHERVYGPEHPEVAAAVNNLGMVLRDLGDLAGARECFERALTVDERVFGPEHPDVARDVNNLGRVLQDLGDLVGARAAHERALAIDERIYGPDHINVARDVNNLGLVLRDLGDLDGAQAAFERALAISERIYGPDRPKVAIRVNNLGLVLRDLGSLVGARAAFERALRIWRAAYGDEHPQVATAHNNLALVLRDLGDLAGARECFERALEIWEKFLPPEHPYIGIARGNLERLGGEQRSRGAGGRGSRGDKETETRGQGGEDE